MKVADGMSERVLIIGPARTLREAARMMAARKVGAAVVVNPEHSGVGVLTERDILNSVAAVAMVCGGFRHLVVEGHEVVGLVSMRDIVRIWPLAPLQARRPRGDSNTLVSS